MNRRDFMKIAAASGTSLSAVPAVAASNLQMQGQAEVAGSGCHLEHPDLAPNKMRGWMRHYPTGGELEALVPPIPGELPWRSLRDVVWDTLYDAQVYLPGDEIPRHQRFFQQAVSTRREEQITNMWLSGALPEPQSFLIKEVVVLLLHHGDILAPYLQAVVGTLSIGSREFGRAPLWSLCEISAGEIGQPPEGGEQTDAVIGGLHRKRVCLIPESEYGIVIPERMHFDFTIATPGDGLVWRGRCEMTAAVLLSGWRARGVM